METFKSTDISVIIPSYNSKKTVLQCLEALYSQEELPLEIILVDSSRDDTVEIVKEHYPDVKILLFNNQGLSRSSQKQRGICCPRENYCFYRFGLHCQ